LQEIRHLWSQYYEIVRIFEEKIDIRYKIQLLGENGTLEFMLGRHEDRTAGIHALSYGW